MKIKGYLRIPKQPGARQLQMRVPAKFQPPEAVGNWEYLLPPEEQGTMPWCAAYAQCAILQAAAWRHPDCGYPVQYSESSVYKTAKALDGDSKPGTSLESVMAASEQLYGVRCNERAFTEALDVFWAIHQYGLALVGLGIDEGWNSPRNSDGLIIPYGKYLGGHAVVVDWYNRRDNRLGGPNWWGRGWGSRGRWSMLIGDFVKQFIYGYAQAPEFLDGFPK